MEVLLYRQKLSTDFTFLCSSEFFFFVQVIIILEYYFSLYSRISSHFLNPFTLEFLKWTLLSLNLESLLMKIVVLISNKKHNGN